MKKSFWTPRGGAGQEPIRPKLEEVDSSNMTSHLHSQQANIRCEPKGSSEDGCKDTRTGRAGDRTPMAVWREAIAGDGPVDMMDNASALPTCPIARNDERSGFQLRTEIRRSRCAGPLHSRGNSPRL